MEGLGGKGLLFENVSEFLKYKMKQLGSSVLPK